MFKMLKKTISSLLLILLCQASYATTYVNNFDSMASMNGWDPDLHVWDTADGWSVSDNRLIINRDYTTKNSGYYYVAQQYLDFELTVTMEIYTKGQTVIPFRYHNAERWYGLYMVPGRRTDNFRFVKWVVGGQDEFTGTIQTAYASFYFMPRRDYCIKLKVLGNNFYAKAWPKTEPEPSNWQLQVQDSTITTAGYIGLSIQRAGTYLHGNFSNLTIEY